MNDQLSLAGELHHIVAARFAHYAPVAISTVTSGGGPQRVATIAELIAHAYVEDSAVVEHTHAATLQEGKARRAIHLLLLHWFTMRGVVTITAACDTVRVDPGVAQVHHQGAGAVDEGEGGVVQRGHDLVVREQNLHASKSATSHIIPTILNY